ncbi:NAD(P)H-dependent oxidoreductase [Fictibacillus solisalsi]|nr:NAD(P)H-dependent oxidoreductase [Fictibacillus solisalsi]
MNHLLLYCHPSNHSFNHALLDVYSEELEKKGHSVIVRNLYDLAFNPILTEREYENSLEGQYEADVLNEQKYIAWCDCITLIYPVWWGGMPALLKGYIDRVFTYGFAYELDGEDPIPRLKGKQLLRFARPVPLLKFMRRTGCMRQWTWRATLVFLSFAVYSPSILSILAT